jgi:membrane protease YdiL (CAAX protease family)
MSSDPRVSVAPEPRLGAAMAVAQVAVLAVPLHALYTGLQALVRLIIGSVDQGFRAYAIVSAEIAVGVIVIVAYRIGVRLLERRRVTEAFVSTGWLLALVGSLVGAALFCVMYVVFWWMGYAAFAGVRGFDGVPRELGLSIVSGISEEVILRGGVYRPFEDAFGTLPALIVSGALFGLLHAGNPAATAVSTVAIAVEAGVLLGLAYTATRSLWFPIGIHFGWNFTEGGIFGAVVSGFRSNGILDVRLSGPELITGGAFGPEASLVCVIVCQVGAAVIGWAAVRAGRWRPLRFAVRSGA